MTYICGAPGVYHRTRYRELEFAKIEPGCWQFIDAETKSQIGPHYASKAELLADLERYAREFGCGCGGVK